MAEWTFSVPEGYFDDCAKLAAQLPAGRLTTQPLFALTPRAYPSDDAAAKDQRPWARFTAHVEALNRESADNVAYKILFCTRHGEGYHNLRSKHEVVGDEAEKEDDPLMFDARLTPLGITQAATLSKHWLASIATDGLPVPQTLYTSPLTRCLQTSQLYLQRVMAAADRAYQPIVKENLRERWTRHACDQRRPRASIAANWPKCTIEDGFPEEDGLGRLPREETEAENQARVLAALADVFADQSEAVVVAWTFHSLAMHALLGALGMVPFKVQPATTIALLVRGEKKKKEDGDVRVSPNVVD